ncbi:MAG: nuclear transport factor 2 family protein, partial [Streptosporangiaceae bacterium]
ELYDALGRGDMPAVLDAIDPGIQWREPGSNPRHFSSRSWHGLNTIVNNLFTRLAAEWDGFTVRPEEFYEAGSVIVVEARYTGTCRQTGMELDARVCHIWKFSDGKVTSFQQYVNTAQLLDAEEAR